MTQGAMNAATELHALVVDDEPLARARMSALLSDCKEPLVIRAAQAASAAQALEMLHKQRFDVLLLDIHMPGMDGLQLARTLRNMERPPVVVFVTAHVEHALQAFELEALDYLTKPVRLERLQQALQKVARAVQVRDGASGLYQSQEALVIQDRGRTERVLLQDVQFCKAELKYITVRTAQRSYILDSSLNELEERYGDVFLRIHRNALIARRLVRALEKYHDAEEGDGWAVRLQGVDEPLAVSRRQLSAVRALIGR